MHPSLTIGCQLYQNAVTFYSHLSVFSQGKFKIWSGKVRERISDSEIRTNHGNKTVSIPLTIALVMFQLASTINDYAKDGGPVV